MTKVLPKQVAVKIICLNEVNETQSNKLPTIIKICKNCCELKNVLSIFEIFISGENVYIVGEYASEGSLDKVIEKVILAQEKLSEDNIKMLMEPIFRGIASLHSKNIVYNNLSLKNVLGTRDCSLKLAGFHHMHVVQSGVFSYGKANDMLNLGIMLKKFIGRNDLTYSFSKQYLYGYSESKVI